MLIVDDEQLVREYTGRVLEAAGYRTDTAADGAEALEVLAALRRCVDDRARSAASLKT